MAEARPLPALSSVGVRRCSLCSMERPAHLLCLQWGLQPSLDLGFRVLGVMESGFLRFYGLGFKYLGF